MSLWKIILKWIPWMDPSWMDGALGQTPFDRPVLDRRPLMDSDGYLLLAPPLMDAPPWADPFLGGTCLDGSPLDGLS